MVKKILLTPPPLAGNVLQLGAVCVGLWGEIALRCCYTFGLRGEDFEL